MWLRRSESFFKTDMVYLAKGGLWQIFGQVGVSIITLGLTIIFANLLPKETYGLYRYILSLAGVLGIFTLTGMNQAVSQSVASGNDGAFRMAVKYQLKWNMIQLLAFWAVSFYYFTEGANELSIAMLVLGIFSPLTLAFNTYGAYLEGKKQFSLNNIFSILSTLIYVGGMVTAILLSGEVRWLAAAYAITTFVSTFFFYFLTLKKFHPPINESGETLKYGRELTIIGAMGPLVSQIDKIILSHFWGATQLAVYSLAIAVPERATSLIKSWVSIGLPKFSVKSPKEINQVFFIRIAQGIAIGAICFVAYYFSAPYLFKYLLPNYLDSVGYSQILALSFLFALPNRYVSLLLTSQKASKIMFVNHTTHNVLRIALYGIFGMFGGIIGLIAARVFMDFIGMLINIYAWKLHKSS